MVDIHLIAGLYQLLGFQSAEISEIIGCIDEILMKIVDDIDALVGATSKSLYCIHQYFYLGVILLTDMIHLVGTEEEIAFFFIHKPFDYYPRLQKYSILAHPTKSVAGPNQTPTIFNGLSFKFATFATWNIKQT